MNLIIDIGNTRVKLAIFDQNHLVTVEHTDLELLVKKIDELLAIYPVEHSILSTVVELDPQTLSELHKKLDVMILSTASKVPFENKYETKHTLGLDRIALIMAAYHTYPKQNCLVIDAGTCITYDFLSHKSIYRGGSISPGLLMRFKALSRFTNKLPKLTPENTTALIGSDTNSSIQTGIIHGVLAEIEDKIDRYANEFGDLTVVLTGGDMNFLSKQLKNSIFATQNFLLVGLNALLNYNKR